MITSEDTEPRVIPAGDAAAMVAFKDEISLEVNAQVHALARALEERRPPGVEDMVVAYSTLLIEFDPLSITFADVKDLVQETQSEGLSHEATEQRLIELPTVYGGCYGRDVPEIARLKSMTEEEVIGLHSSATYTVYMLGFSPGLPYMGGLPPELVLPRLETPRERVPEGTVAIANQTVIYALTSPGGWWWVGRTPIKMFDPSKDPPTYLQAGDKVRFAPITEDDYLAMGGERCS